MDFWQESGKRKVLHNENPFNQVQQVREKKNVITIERKPGVVTEGLWTP